MVHGHPFLPHNPHACQALVSAAGHTDLALATVCKLPQFTHLFPWSWQCLVLPKGNLDAGSGLQNDKEMLGK
jgi:hypothetical protein